MAAQEPPDRPRVYEFRGRTPVVRAGSFVHPSAVLIGDVVVGAGCYIGPGASLRGDFGRVVLGDGVNIQDNCVLHTFPDRAVIVEDHGHIGHGAVLHGCHVRRDALVGIQAVVMDDVEVGESSIVGALSFLPANRTYPARSLIHGTPAEVVRELSEQEIEWKRGGTREYRKLAADCLATMRAVPALGEEPEDGRGKRDPAGRVAPLWQHRKRKAD